MAKIRKLLVFTRSYLLINFIDSRFFNDLPLPPLPSLPPLFNTVPPDASL